MYFFNQFLISKIAQPLGWPFLTLRILDEPTYLTKFILNPLERNGKLPNSLIDALLVIQVHLPGFA